MAITIPDPKTASTTTYTGTGYTATNATPGSYTGNGYTADKASAETYNATTGTASTYNPTDWTVASDQTVAGQVRGLIDANSPLMQQSRTSALQQANRSGLLNSSMAIGAGQTAVYNAALPIAQQDASTYANAAQTNASAKNAASQFNAGQTQNMTTANMTAKNSADQFNASNNQQVNLANQTASNAAKEYSATATNAANQFNAANTQQTNLANQSATNAASEFSANATNTANSFNAQQANAQNQFNASEYNKILSTQMDTDNKLALAGIERDYKTLMQTNQSVSDMYQMTVKSIEEIQTNKDITADAKATYIKNHLTYLGQYLKITESLNSIEGLDELITT